MKIAHATATAMPGEGYPVDIVTGGHSVRADEPVDNGGADTGASPYGLLLSGLAACTLITLRMYAKHKSWPLETARVLLDFYDEDGAQRIERVLRFDGSLDPEQRDRLLDIAERTPVTLTLKRSVAINTRLAE